MSAPRNRKTGRRLTALLSTGGRVSPGSENFQGKHELRRAPLILLEGDGIPERKRRLKPREHHEFEVELSPRIEAGFPVVGAVGVRHDRRGEERKLGPVAVEVEKPE